MRIKSDGYRICDVCGEKYEYFEYNKNPELCDDCWYIPNHIPEEQRDRFYEVRKNENQKRWI